jgi:broad specificity phosphatase PhoE
MRLVLLRHVESISNKDHIADSQIDLGLTEEGASHSVKLIKKLQKYPFDVIVVSPLERTSETIKPFLNVLKDKPKVLVDKSTIERNLGSFSDTDFGEFQKYCKENNLDKVFHRPPGGESISDVYKRAEKFLNYLKTKFKDKNVLVCGHKNFLLCLEILIKNKDIANYYAYRPFKNGEIREYKL